MSMRHAVLGLLAEGPRHGYELKGALEEELLPLTPVNFGQVYSTLDRLQRDGLLTHEEVAQGERPDKKVYTLTKAGRAELGSWMASPSVPALDLRNETFLKLALSRRLSIGGAGLSASDVVAVERRAAFEQLHQVAQARLQAEEGLQPETGLLLVLAALRLEAFLKWLDECERVLGHLETEAADRRGPRPIGSETRPGESSDGRAGGSGAPNGGSETNGRRDGDAGGDGRG